MSTTLKTAGLAAVLFAAAVVGADAAPLGKVAVQIKPEQPLLDLVGGSRHWHRRHYVPRVYNYYNYGPLRFDDYPPVAYVAPPVVYYPPPVVYYPAPVVRYSDPRRYYDDPVVYRDVGVRYVPAWRLQRYYGW
ncbi:MAG: hypothetical protein AB7O43_13730 [Hyphomicrobiaceae bacterium]